MNKTITSILFVIGITAILFASACYQVHCDEDGSLKLTYYYQQEDGSGNIVDKSVSVEYEPEIMDDERCVYSENLNYALEGLVVNSANPAVNAENHPGLDPLSAIERGIDEMDAIPKDEHSLPIVDGMLVFVKNKATMTSNAPMFTNLSQDNFTDGQNADVDIDLSGHPLYCYLPLSDADDLGGAKEWVLDKLTDDVAGNTPTTNLEEWSCVTDNRYAFQLGSRARYYPGEAQDDNSQLCDDEQERLEGITFDEYLFCRYEIYEENESIYVKILFDEASETLEVGKVEVVSYDFDNLLLKVEHPSYPGTFAYAHMVNGEVFEEITDL